MPKTAFRNSTYVYGGADVISALAVQTRVSCQDGRVSSPDIDVANIEKAI